MDVKEAVATAKSYVADLFAEENFSDLGLEEVSLDEQADQWVVTLGFARPWERAATKASRCCAARLKTAKIV